MAEKHTGLSVCRTRIPLTVMASVLQTTRCSPGPAPPVVISCRTTRHFGLGFADFGGLWRRCKMQSLSRALALSFCFAALVAVGASHALGNSGTLLPLDQYQAGTEHVQNTIVTNGNFENSTT